MTPTEQDNELRAEVKQILKDGFDYYILERKNTSSDMKPLDVYCTEHLMQLITADRKRVALEARIDEIKKYCTPSIYQAARQLNLEIPKTWEVAHELGLTPMMADGRIKELKAQQEEV